MGASPASTGQEQQDALEVFLSKRGLQCIRVYPSSQSRFDFTMARVLAWDPVRGGQKQIDGFAGGLRKTDGSGRTWMNLDGLGRADPRDVGFLDIIFLKRNLNKWYECPSSYKDELEFER